jgi:hypothetical protein
MSANTTRQNLTCSNHMSYSEVPLAILSFLTMYDLVQTARWLSSDVTQRFSSVECVEKRTWEELAHEMKGKQDIFTTGSLGTQKTENFHVWACFNIHSCLSVVSHSDGDAMCYAFHETQEQWYPMGLLSEVFSECSAQ